MTKLLSKTWNCGGRLTQLVPAGEAENRDRGVEIQAGRKREPHRATERGQQFHTPDLTRNGRNYISASSAATRARTVAISASRSSIVRPASRPARQNGRGPGRAG